MERSFALLASLGLLAFTTVVGITGCGSIHTAPLPSSSVRLTPNPPEIYLAPFNIETGKWLVGRDGVDLVDFKKGFQTNFLHTLQDRLTKLAPTEPRWLDDLPDHGWMVAGDFTTVFQGSRALRGALGFGYGQTTLQTTVYVYDLSISKTEYVFSFRTGVPDPVKDTGAGSGEDAPIEGIGSGLKLDTSRTCREIADVLSHYM